MIKRIVTLILTLSMLVCFSACGCSVGNIGNDSNNDNNNNMNNGNGNDSTTPLEGVNAPVDILNTVWSSYTEDERFFATGGDANTPVDNAPGPMDIADADSMLSLAVCPAEALDMIDGSASLMHAMNANNFTGVAYHLKDTADANSFTAAMKNAIENNQWLCGFPEKLMIATLADDYVVVAFGSATIVDTFKAKLTSAYDVARITTDESLG